MAQSKQADAGNKKPPQHRAGAALPKGNFVRATTRTLELTRLGHAVNFQVYQKGRLLGRLEVGLGALRWSPAGRRSAEMKTIPWKVFATMIRGWPFGEPVKARLKFEKGHLRWRSPGKKGQGRTITWDEFVRRMEAPSRAPRRSVSSSAPASLRSAPSARERKPRLKAANNSPAKPERLSAIFDLMRRTKNLRFKTENGAEVLLQRTGGDKSPGSIHVRINGKRKGVIGLDGTFTPSPTSRRETPTVAAALRAFNRNPMKKLVDYGRTGTCAICGRPLTNPTSVARGIGPVCAAKLGLD